ncbi:MAG TPA: ABC transporter permease [Alphaproteobacteria bacterium]|jgi:peptide/nickel transport system permease protein
MFAYLVNRLLQAIGVMLVVALFAFIISNYVGDPINNMLGQDATHEDRARLRQELGLDDPAPVQFGRFVGEALRGNFGISYQMKRPVSHLIIERLPATLELVFVAAIIALVLGITGGVFTGLRRNAVSSRAIMTISLVGVSLPTFVIGILLIYGFAVLPKSCVHGVHLFGTLLFDCADVAMISLPSFGRGETVDIGAWQSGLFTAEGWRHLILPGVTLSLFNLTLILRLVRSEMLEVLRTDYIKFARARGLTDRAVHFGHALKNTLVPVITVAGIQIGSLIAFSTITETVFQWPGMGLLFIQSVQFADVPIMTAYLVMAALIFVVINFTVDVLYATIDPRLRADRVAAGRA